MNTYLKDIKKSNGAIPLDKELTDKYYSDFMVEAKNLKVKIAEYVKKDPDVAEVNMFSMSVLTQSKSSNRRS